MSRWTRSSKPISWHSTEKTRMNRTKANDIRQNKSKLKKNTENVKSRIFPKVSSENRRGKKEENTGQKYEALPYSIVWP